MKLEQIAETLAQRAGQERRGVRAIGHLVALNGVHGIISSEINFQAQSEPWSVGALISIHHKETRLVGQICDIATADRGWREDGVNTALIKVELTGEVIDDAAGRPKFHRGVKSFPSLGAVAHCIRAADLRAVFAVDDGHIVEMGVLSQNPSIPAMVSVEELIRRHFAIVGSTGAGKTTAVAMTVKHCVRELQKLRVLIVDPHNEYSSHFRGQAAVFDADSLELPYWMFRFEELLEVIYAGRKPNSDEADALHEVIRVCKQRFASGGRGTENALRRTVSSEVAWVGADTPVPYRMSDAMQLLDEWAGKLDPRYARADLRTLKNRIDALSHDPRYRFMFGRVMVEDNMAKVIGSLFRLPMERQPVTILQVGGLPNEVVNAVVSVLARLTFEVASASRGEVQVALLCEEAHRYIPANPDAGFEPTRRAIGRIAKEGRKYGASLCIVTQRPSDLDTTVLSQCSTMFAMRLANEKDKDIMGAAAGASTQGALAFLSSLADREAIAFGEAVATPMRLRFADYREFARNEPSRPADAPLEKARELLRQTVARMRGETVPLETPTAGAARFSTGA